MKPRGLRNNNPLNIRHSKDQWQGAAMTQTDTAFVQFYHPKFGYRAGWKILQTYYEIFRKEGKAFTVRNIISRWAPPEDNNNTEGYIRKVLQLSSIGGREKLLPPRNVHSYTRLSQLLAAMTCVENGISMNEVDMEDICIGYKLAYHWNRAKLNKLLEYWDEYRDWSAHLEEVE